MHENEISFHNLESPAPGAAISPGWQRLRGWIVPKPGFHFVDVRARIDGRVFPGVHGFPRPDLAAHFEPTRSWLPAEYTIDVAALLGPVRIEIDALNITGSWHAIHTTVHHAAGILGPGITQDPLGAEEFALALQLCLKESGANHRDSVQQVAASIPYPATLRANHPPFHGFIDEPAAISPALYGRLHVLGWLFHETLAIRAVYVSTDLLAFQRLELGGDFPGVIERFPGLPHARNCRLFGFADVSGQLPAPAVARFYAELVDGSIHLCLATQCRPVLTEELKAPHAPFSSERFLSTSQNLRATFDERNVPLETGRNGTRLAWNTFWQYRREAPARGESGHATVLSRSNGGGLNRRVLLVTHNLNLEGAPLLFVEYARHLVQTGHATLLVLSGQEGPLRKEFEHLGARVEVVDVASLLSADSSVELRRRLTEMVASLQLGEADLVVANTIFSFWAVHLATLIRRPSLLYIHESTSPATFFRDRIPPGLTPAVQEAFNCATAVSFNTPATAAYYRAGVAGDNFHFTSAWIDVQAIDAFRSAHSPRSLREQLGMKRDEYLIANIGTVCDRKGQHDFLRAIEWLWRLRPTLAARCTFVMVGGRDTPYNRFLAQAVTDLGRPNIQLIAETSRVYDYFGAADLFVCTSYEESFPRVVLEAMAFEVPIVSTNVHGIPYMLTSGKDALLVNPGDIDALTRALIRVLEDSLGAKVRAKSGRVRVAEFDSSLVLPKHAALTDAVAATQA